MLHPLPNPFRLLATMRGPAGSLRRKLLEGSAWNLGATLYGSGLLVLQTLLATHLLAEPSELGLVNAVMWSYTMAEVFTSSGLTLALARHRGDARALEGPVWTVGVVRGIVLGIGVGLVGTGMASHYGEPRIAPLAWAAALSAPLNGLAGLGPVLALRELSFRRVAIAGAVETTLGAAACAVLLVTLRSAWAVILGLNTLALARIAVSYAMRPRRPRLDFRWNVLRPFAGFAVSAFLASILAFANERGDDFVVGTMLGLGSLGIYHVAFLYANLPGVKLGQVVGNLLVPTLAELCGEPRRLRAAYLKCLAVLLTLAAALMAPLFVLAPAIFAAIGGGKLLAAVPAFRVLCLFGFLRFFQFSADAAFVALGRPKHVTLAQLAQFVVMAALIAPLTARWGTSGAGAAVAAASGAAAVYSACALSRLLAVPATTTARAERPSSVEEAARPAREPACVG